MTDEKLTPTSVVEDRLGCKCRVCARNLARRVERYGTQRYYEGYCESQKNSEARTWTTVSLPDGDSFQVRGGRIDVDADGTLITGAEIRKGHIPYNLAATEGLVLPLRYSFPKVKVRHGGIAYKYKILPPCRDCGEYKHTLGCAYV